MTTLLPAPASAPASGVDPVETAPLPPRGRSERCSLAGPLYLTAFVGYAGIGMLLSLHYFVVDPDGPSRVANAAYVLFSRDPHLAAVGFVWNPLPSLVDLPLLALARAWPPLLSEGQAGTFMAAAFMAGAVVQVRGIAVDRGLPLGWRWIVVGCFACNPMIVLYGGNGMSESPFVFFMLWAARRLLRWIRSQGVNDLVLAGVAMGLGYLTRYETAAAALACTLLVVGIAALRAPEPGRGERWKAAAVEGTVFAFPFALSFVGWAAVSWIATGEAFAQLSSQYGNSSQTAAASSFLTGFEKAAGGPIEIVVRDVLHLAPFLPVLAVAVLVLAVRRVELDSLVPVAVFGGVLAFEAVEQLTGSLFGWFRFFIMAVPLTVVLAVLLWPGPEHRSASRAPSPKRVVLAGVLLAALLLPSLPTTWLGMLDPLVGTEYETNLRTIVDPSRYPLASPRTSDDWYLAGYLDRLDLPEGSVLMDTFTGWDIWLASDRRKQFVITSDYDFTAALNAPAAFGIRYILVADPAQDGGMDAVNRRYPSLYRDGAGIATLVASVPASGIDEAWAYYSWRLYRVDGSGSSSTSTSEGSEGSAN